MKLCIFDMGGVVSVNTGVGPIIAAHLGISEQSFYAFCNNANMSGLTTGRITAEEFWRNFAETSGMTVEEDLWKKFFHPVYNPGTVALIHELKQHMRVVVGTNTIESHYAVHVEAGDYDIFQAIYASNKIGVAKPNPDFHRYILEAEEVEPAETVFIDDSLVNCAVAAELGIHSIGFVSAEDLRAKLIELGCL